MKTSEIERILRQAPRPAPPAGLKQRLAAQVRVPQVTRAGQPWVPAASTGHWLARWWPALGAAAIFLACVAVLAVQHMEIRSLEQAFPPAPVQVQPELGSLASPGPRDGNRMSGAQDSAARQLDEIARLKALAARLAAEVSRLEQLHSENSQLRAQLAAASATRLAPDETAALQKAHEKALAIQCVNNLKQLALAARIWAVDNGDIMPPNLLNMTNAMSTPKILVCPADSGRQVATDWTSFSAGNCSYEYLAPSAPDHEPTRVMFRCPIHGSVALCDGSVQMEVAKSHPEWLIQREGKLYLQVPAVQEPPAPPPSGDTSFE